MKQLLIILIIQTFLAYPIIVSSSEKPNDGKQYNNILFKSQLTKDDGPEVQIREAYFPPGWKAPRHYHNSNLFIYIIEGEFEVELAGSEKIVYTKGQGTQMQAGIEMEARNASDTKSLKLAVFQVGNPDAPFTTPVE